MDEFKADHPTEYLDFQHDASSSSFFANRGTYDDGLNVMNATTDIVTDLAGADGDVNSITTRDIKTSILDESTSMWDFGTPPTLEERRAEVADALFLELAASSATSDARGQFRRASILFDDLMVDHSLEDPKQFTIDILMTLKGMDQGESLLRLLFTMWPEVTRNPELMMDVIDATGVKQYAL